MIDIQLIRDNPEHVATKSRQKGVDVDTKHILELDHEQRQLQQHADELRAKRNDLAAANKGGKPDEKTIEEGKALKEQINIVEEKLLVATNELELLLNTVPNVALDEVPVGDSEEENKVIKTVGEKPQFDFKPKNHWEIAQDKDWIDKERAARVAGSRFVYIKGDLARLEFALWQYALDVLTDENKIKEIIKQADLNVPAKPFTFVLPPAVAKTEVYQATGRLDKEQTTYKLEDDDLWLNASAEHTLAPMYLGEIIEHDQLPIRLVGYTTAFRREAGTYGKDMEGMLRLHQFNKLEMESFTSAANSYQEHLFMVAVQEYLMQQLGLPYQVLEKCTADIGFPNAKGVDLEVWLPGQNKYRETHTADYITDFQARGMKTRIRQANGSIEYAHTNDATAFSERPLIGIIENNQTIDGDVVVPEALRPYFKKNGEMVEKI